MLKHSVKNIILFKNSYKKALPPCHKRGTETTDYETCNILQSSCQLKTASLKPAPPTAATVVTITIHNK